MLRDAMRCGVVNAAMLGNTDRMSVHRDELSFKTAAMRERMIDVGLEARLNDVAALRIGLDAARDVLAPDTVDGYEHVPRSDVVVIN